MPYEEFRDAAFIVIPGKPPGAGGEFVATYFGFGNVNRTVEVDANDESDVIEKANQQVEESGLEFAEEFKLLGLEKVLFPAKQGLFGRETYAVVSPRGSEPGSGRIRGGGGQAAGLCRSIAAGIIRCRTELRVRSVSRGASPSRQRRTSDAIRTRSQAGTHVPRSESALGGSEGLSPLRPRPDACSAGDHRTARGRCQLVFHCLREARSKPRHVSAGSRGTVNRSAALHAYAVQRSAQLGAISVRLRRN